MINSISLALRAGSDDDGVVIVQSSSLFELSRFGHLRRTSRAYSAAIARSGILLLDISDAIALCGGYSFPIIFCRNPQIVRLL